MLWEGPCPLEKRRFFASRAHFLLRRRRLAEKMLGASSESHGRNRRKGDDGLLAKVRDREDLWVFGYGSLMWRPGFDYVESALAWVHGYHRSLCIFSHVHRGTPERPGLVLGLDRGGSCQGVAFRVAARDRENTIAYLRERELVTSVYLEKTVGVRFAEGGCVNALAYVVDRSHCQYAGRLPFEEMTRLVAEGVGVNGDNPAYVRNTYEHLLQLDIHDPELAEIVRRLDSVSCRTAPAEL
jgi:cation transport protein ChaC